MQRFDFDSLQSRKISKITKTQNLFKQIPLRKSSLTFQVIVTYFQGKVNIKLMRRFDFDRLQSLKIVIIIMKAHTSKYLCTSQVCLCYYASH